MLVIVLVVLVALIAAGGVSAYTFLTRDDPVVYGNIVEQYKYGSIGTEELQGVPYELWVVLPEVFEDLLPPGPGKGYERLGFTYEPGHATPIGTTYREKPIGLLGLTCGLCHVGTYRESASSPRQIVLGMPANRMRLWDYIQFLRRVGRDERFNADTLLAAIERRFPGRLSFFDRQFWRYAVIPEARKGLRKADRDFAWLNSRPPYGPGRVDTFNPVKQRANFDMEADHTSARWTSPRSGSSAPGPGYRCNGTATTAACKSGTSPQHEPSAGRTTPSTSTSSSGLESGCSICPRLPFRPIGSTARSRAGGSRSMTSNAPRATTSAARESAR